MPKYPQSQDDFALRGSEFSCAQCGKVTSTHAYFAISALGLMDKGKTGAGRMHSPADVAKLSLWHVVDHESRKGHELLLSEGHFNGGVANVVFCSADCLKSYLLASVDELVSRSAKA
jgi:hypothetical protein